MLKHGYIGTEHILLGLLREREGLAARALESLDVTHGRVRAQVVDIVGSGEEPASRQIPFSAGAKKVLHLALCETVSLGNHYVGVDQILLALVRETEEVAGRILVGFGVDSQKIRDKLRTLKAETLSERREARLRANEIRAMRALIKGELRRRGQLG